MKKTILLSSLAALTASVAFSRNDAVAQISEPNPAIYLEQGWSSNERGAWYTATQGSRLMPASWFRSLEIPQGTTLFNSPSNMSRYRFIYDEDNPANPYPIGFAEDRQSDSVFDETQLRWLDRGLFGGQSKYEEWIGLNCAACHTAEVHFEGARIRIDGGPSIIDFQTFEEEVAQALRATLDDDEKFSRFAARVVSEDPQTRIDRLRSALEELTVWRERVVSINATDLRSGFARLDAFGHIYNQVALFSDVEGQFFEGADAPVSFPFLWDTPQHDKVQWNGIASNGPSILGIDVGALGRNAGEVIGVFGEVNVDKRTGSDLLLRPRAVSSVSINNLIELERHAERLVSPQWPHNILGQLDMESVERGRELFVQECQSCHNPIDRDDPERSVTAQMSLFLPIEGLSDEENENTHGAPGTDPAMACRSVERQALRGSLYDGFTIETENGQERELQEREQLSALLTVMVKSALFDQAGELVDFIGLGSDGLIVQNPGNYNTTGASTQAGAASASRESTRDSIIAGVAEPVFATAERTQLTLPFGADVSDWGPFQECMTTNPSWLKSYKARPLNGIWATAPFLHNGSVPNLYELLLPPEQRMPVFYTGSYQFDPVRVGYVTTESETNSFRFDTFMPDGSVRWGNFNGGHDYGNAALTDQQRWDLVEYMKSL
ncbi:hypothetical protein GRI43_12565 [Altererythrobacter luteolus]|uniref:Cytochrome c domain-containing protein n=1 Tax=Pontixanthobacter luteolus TaxID=295089 RepID=A0A6I4V5Y4_9SPHN|nr:di-heme-cytochrome C peroxidase [Pontixanthobacter luteolus]MXP48220.1 hypothetical protein [Pontixanthobacter luteolus]